MRNKKLTGILVDFKETETKTKDGRLSIVCNVACDDGSNPKFYVNNVTLTKSGKWSVAGNSQIAKLYRLAIGRNDKQVYSDARRIFTALKTKNIKLDCEVELHPKFSKVKALCPLNPVYSDSWDDSGALIEKGFKKIRVCMNATLEEALSDKRELELSFKGEKVNVSLSEIVNLMSQKQLENKMKEEEVALEFNQLMEEAKNVKSVQKNIQENEKDTRSFAVRILERRREKERVSNG